MKSSITISTEKKLIGQRLTMSFSDYRIAELWKSFIPRRREIIQNLNTDLISLAVFAPGYFENFDPTNEFDRWATVEVDNFENIPDEMEAFVLPGGLYAVFNYKGLSTDNSIFQYILGTWLPNSDYILDNRPHFEVLGNKYRNSDPASEEEIWIPVRMK